MVGFMVRVLMWVVVVGCVGMVVFSHSYGQVLPYLNNLP